MDQGFIDLRHVPDEITDHGNFWPSFTDIMTTVVMIFMIATTLAVLRNWDLIQNLRTSVQAEQEAMQAVRAAHTTNQDLGDQLTQTEQTLVDLRVQLMQAQESATLNAERLAEKERNLTALQENLTTLQEDLSASTRQTQALAQQVQQAQAEQALLQQRLAEKDASLISARDQLAGFESTLTTLEADKQKQAQEITDLRQQTAQSEQVLNNLREGYSVLKVKYDKLVQPARSAQGKEVVEVHYRKGPQGLAISLREPGAEALTAVNKGELDRRLAALTDKHRDQLYIKIVIPTNSGLSYNEAWSFTHDLLTKYDYYYRAQESQSKSADQADPVSP